MTWLRRIGGWALAALATAVLAVGILMATGSLPYRLYAVTSGSMEPGLPVKSVVVVDAQRSYSPGDVIAFHAGPTVATHRLVGENADGSLVTQGDARQQPDPFTTSQSDVIGPVVVSAPELGYWLVYLKQPAGLASVLAGAVAIWMVFSVAADLTGPSPEPAPAGKAPRRPDPLPS
jgi:signal peptidase